MRVDIRPQWQRIADWYWEDFYQDGDGHISIWGLMEREYGARKAFSTTAMDNDRGMWVVFPDEKSYTAFLLRWA